MPKKLSDVLIVAVQFDQTLGELAKVKVAGPLYEVLKLLLGALPTLKSPLGTAMTEA